MKVKVRSFAGFRHILGRESEVELDQVDQEDKVGDLLNALCAAHGELRALLFDQAGLKEDVNILVNGKNIESLQGMKTELSEGDEVAIFPAAIGG
ncbi:MAG TPA: ubiquitin-like small modifier protein 1 [Methanotrichaceae archaeon]|nr:ubiquitin-like small modifier protein 1 [Methanotrichaceae archaeon]